MGDMLKGRTALVTGSTSGIGLAIATSLAEEGARIALHGLPKQEEIDAALAQIGATGAEARFFDGDLRDPDKVEALVAAVADWGPVDILVNNAGMQKTVTIAEADRAVWDAVIGLNLSACFHAMRLVLPGMKARGFGRVINIASVHGIVASQAKAPYVASKFGLVGLTKVAALEYADAGTRESGGVTVNAICPGWVETPLIEPQIAARAEQHGGDRDAAVRSLLAEKQPSLRTAEPSDIGAAALYLCSRAAHNVTGVSLPIDGGWTSQ
ncbi:MAG: 3-hydroxybutyrate dehydrogenase [Rubrimonas sp.]|uniref:3-hydroxybutyrate dehydrogenase n=1 Tax=Rubrimonas sp. TaxID=2036015 RepID=UPI002FDED27D